MRAREWRPEFGDSRVGSEKVLLRESGLDLDWEIFFCQPVIGANPVVDLSL